MLTEYEARELSRAMTRELNAGATSVLLSAAGLLAVVMLVVFGDALLPESGVQPLAGHVSHEQALLPCPTGHIPDCSMERADE